MADMHSPALFAEDFGAFTPTVLSVAAALAATAAARDKAGGTALAERQLLRDSGLLTLAVPQAFGGQGAAWPPKLSLIHI